VTPASGDLWLGDLLARNQGRQLEFRSELPESMVGKVLRRALTEPGSAP
jgi:hypothetical protein